MLRAKPDPDGSEDGMRVRHINDTDGGRPPVVQVVPYYWPHIGGMEVVAQTIAEGLARDRHVEVLTSTSAPAPSARSEHVGNLWVRRFSTLEFAHVPFMPTLPIHLACLPRRVVVHVHIAVAYAPEAVWLYSKLLRRPYIAHFHLDVDPSGRFGPLFLLYKRFILGRVLRSAARVIAVSPDQPEFLMRTYGVRREQIELIPNDVRSEFFLGRRREPDPARKFRLLFVGRLAPQKNVPLLLNALAAMTEPVEVRIVGDGEDRPMLERLIGEFRLDNAQMVGAKVGRDLIDEYRWADAFVLTSRKESTGLVLLEAMAAGLPVVATNVVGVRDTVGDDGLLVVPDPAALAEALDRLVRDPALWRNLAERSANRAVRHRGTTCLDRLQEIYAEVWP
jgi:glycosyltransferase involved in cell wall biosynthesis